MPYSNPITTQEQQDLARYNPLHPRDGSANELYMPPAYFLVPPATQAGPVKWRLFDAAYISTGIIDPNRLGTGATGAGNLYLADDGQWKPVAGGGGGGDMYKATYDTDNSGIVDKAEALATLGRNSTGATLYEGTIVRIEGSTGNRPNFVKAQGNNDANSAQTFGVVMTDIANNSDGYVLVQGTLHDLDTRTGAGGATHPFTDVTLVDGDLLYLHPTIPGYVTNIKPSAPQHLVYVGVVTRTSPTNGTIVYRIQNGYELYELHDVAPTPYINNGVLYRDTTDNLWKSATIATLLGGTPLLSVPTLDQVTTAGNTTTNAITVGGLTVDTDTLYVDSVNNRVGIGTTTFPTITGTLKLFVDGSGSGSNGRTFFAVRNTSSSSAANFSLINSAGKLLNAQISGPSYTTGEQAGFFTQGAIPLYFMTDGGVLSGGTSRILFYAGGYGVSPTMTITAGNTGNVLIGTTTDAGFKLDVNGTMRSVGLITAPGGISTVGGGIQIGDSTAGAIFYDASNRIYNNTAYGWVLQSWSYNHLTATNGLLISNSTSSTKSSNSYLQVVGSTTAASAIGRGVYFNNTLVAAANNDVLVGLDIDPTFTNGAFTGVTNYGLRVGGSTGLLYDTVNKRLGIGVTAPTFDLDIQTATTDTDLLRVINPGGSASVNRGAGIIVTMLNTQVTGGRTRIRQYDTSGYGPSNYIDFVSGTGAPTTEGSTFINGFYEVGLGVSGTKRLSVGTAGVAVTGTFSNTTGVQLATSSGNVLIGTTTDAGFRLDVNGTSRFTVANDVTMRMTNDSGSYSIGFVSNSGATAIATIFNANSYDIRVANSNVFTLSNITRFSINPVEITAAGSGGILTIRNSANTALQVATLSFAHVSGTTSVTQIKGNVGRGFAPFSGGSLEFFTSAFSASAQQNMRLSDIGQLLIGNGINLDSHNASAILQVNSTTQGFLQPRMTNAQAVAIATPATGLQVYDTTNNKNLLHNGTAWQNIATESWVTAQGYLTSAPTPTLAQVTTAGNTTTNSITVGASVIDGITIWDSNSSGIKNIGIGFQSLLNSTTGSSNTAVGYRAGEATTTGTGNDYFGDTAGLNNLTGIGNVFLGGAAGFFEKTANYNVYVGNAAGGGLADGTSTTGNNVAIGRLAGNNSSGGDNVFLGHSAGRNSTVSNRLIIGNRNNSSLLEGNFSTGNILIGTSTDSGYKLDVNGTVRILGNLYMNDATNRTIYGINGTYINLYNGGTGGMDFYSLGGNAESRFFGGLRVTGNLITQGSFSMNGNLDIGSNNFVGAVSNGIRLYRGFDASMQFYLGHPTVGDFVWDYPENTTLMRLRRNGNLLINTNTDSGYKLDVNGSFRSNGDSYVTSANGRVFGFDGLSAGQTLHFQYGGDSNHRISTTHGSAAQMDVYHGLIIRTSSASGGKALIVNQRNSAHFIQEWQENGTQKAYINSQGNLYLAQLDAEADGPVISTSGLLSSVAGYTGTVTIQQPAPLPPINIDVQNGIIVNVF